MHSTKPKPKWIILPFLWQSLKRLCMVLGFFALLTMVLGFFSTMQMLTPQKTSLPRDIVLYLELNGDLPEQHEKAGFADPFAFNKPSLYDFITTLDTATHDKRVKGIYARLNETAGYSLAQIQELRAALKRFQSADKFAYIYATSYGAGGGMGAYYLASVFDEIWLQPIGAVGITGMSAQIPFARSALDKIGVDPQFLQRKEYKSAYESAMRDDISPANAEMMGTLIGDIRTQMITDIASDRKLSQQKFQTLVDKGLFTAQDAKSAGLVTHADYADVLVSNISEALTGEREGHLDLFVPMNTYIKAKSEKPKRHASKVSKKSKVSKAKMTLSETKPIASSDTKSDASTNMDFNETTKLTAETPNTKIQKSKVTKPKVTKSKSRPTVALIYASGAIMPSATNAQSSARAPLGALGGNVAAADEIATALIEAADNDNIKAVVLRIDSPGGSPTASETILRAVQRVQKNNKPVIVSMGNAAASGGYWIATYADTIFAHPGTITGSIGVIGGKLSFQEMWSKLGINWAEIEWGQNSGLWSFNEPFSESEKARYDIMLDSIYDAFITRVSEGRNMSKQQVELIAKGRVWSGKRAVDIGLADELGGLHDALNYTARHLGKTDYTQTNIITLPPPKSTLEQFLELVGEGASISAGLSNLSRITAPILESQSLQNLGVMSDGQPKIYAPLVVE